MRKFEVEMQIQNPEILADIENGTFKLRKDGR